MCMYCHRDDPVFNVPNPPSYNEVHAKAHGDGDPACLRMVSPPNEESTATRLMCIDCGEEVQGTLENEDHVCYVA